MLVWATVAEQYRIAWGELKYRQPASSHQEFFSRKCAILENTVWR